MRINQLPTRVAFLDFETCSEEPLTTVSKYCAHPSTSVLTLCIRVDGVTHRMGPEHFDVKFLVRIAAERTLVAHNAPFDSAVWAMVGLPDAEWCDTLPKCRAAGLPGRLDAVGEVLTGRGKDPAGKRLIDLLCKLKPGRPVPAVGPAHRLLLGYNARDVELLEEVYERVKSFHEPRVVEADYAINQRGIPLDLQFMETMRGLFAQNDKRARAEFADRTDGVCPTSPKQVAEWLMRMGFAPYDSETERISIGKKVYKELVADPQRFFVGDDDSDMAAAFSVVHEAMETRREIARVAAGKLEAAFECREADGRARDQHVYWGAHTGRWTGRAMQVHNFPTAALVRGADLRGVLAEPDYGEAVKLAHEMTEKSGHRVAVSDILGSMLRSMVRPPGGCISGADYGAVELRGTAWVAGEDRMLSLLSDPKQSVYLDTGERLFHTRLSKEDERYNFCKALVLGSTYGMSGAKFEMLCKQRNISVRALQEAGSSIRETVKVFRETYPRIPAVWRAYNEAALYAVRGCPMEAGRCKFYMVGADLRMELPSGRCIVYRNARVEDTVPSYVYTYNLPKVAVPTVIYENPRRMRSYLYGSKICENAVQGICRDILADAAANCEQEGLAPFLHVHDELNNETDKLNRVVEIMSTPPVWAPGFPLLVEGYCMPMWSKQTKGHRELKAMNGRVL